MSIDRAVTYEYENGGWRRAVRSNAQARPTRNTDAWGTHCSAPGHPPRAKHRALSPWNPSRPTRRPYGWVLSVSARRARLPKPALFSPILSSVDDSEPPPRSPSLLPRGKRVPRLQYRVDPAAFTENGTMGPPSVAASRGYNPG